MYTVHIKIKNAGEQVERCQFLSNARGLVIEALYQTYKDQVQYFYIEDTVGEIIYNGFNHDTLQFTHEPSFALGI